MSGLRDIIPIYKPKSKMFTESSVFIVPANVYTLRFTLIAGGGGGMSFNYQNGGLITSCLAGGGSGGWIERAALAVLPGDQIELVIGSGGNGVMGSQNASTIPPDPVVTIKGQDGGNSIIRNLRTGTEIIVYGGEGAKASLYNAGDGGYPNGSGGGIQYNSTSSTVPTRIPGGCGVYQGGGTLSRRSAGQVAIVTWLFRSMGSGVYPGMGGNGGRAKSLIAGGVNFGSGGDYNIDTTFTLVSVDLRSDVRPGKPGVAILEWME